MELLEKCGSECRCEACNGEDADVSERRRIQLREIEEGLAVLDRQNIFLNADLSGHAIPQPDQEALMWAETKLGLLREEGLVREFLIASVLPSVNELMQSSMLMSPRHRHCSRYSRRVGQAAKAMGYARKELEIERICLGDEDAHREEGLVGARFWIKHLENMSEQEQVNNRMNEKREAKDQKKAAKKAAKGKK